MKYGVLLILSMTVLLFATVASAQEAPTPESIKPGSRPDNRPNLLRELGLAPEQMQQIRRINAERRPQMEEAARRMREANRLLDEAIYADTVNDDEVALRLKSVQEAQSVMARLRFTNELAIRRILTPDQLVRFRDLRRRFAESREEFRNGRKPMRQNMPFKPLNRGQKPISN